MLCLNTADLSLHREVAPVVAKRWQGPASPR
jgi:hypothetical protein